MKKSYLLGIDIGTSACKVAVFDRPWNRQAEFPNDNFVRCKNWNQIDKVFEEYAGNVG